MSLFFLIGRIIGTASMIWQAIKAARKARKRAANRAADRQARKHRKAKHAKD